MPFIRATISDPHLDRATQETLAKGLTQLSVAVLDKPIERTSVHLNLVPAERYFVAGEPVGEATGAHVEVSITAGTNSADEKARFIRETYELLRTTLGLLPPVAGVALYEMHPESYGYNGVTQFDHRRGNPQRGL
ncbi:tautomerase family protein [Streptomyces fulvoviolaceus]|uniref:tautomerase family protein n=1 Tax=Streptomyces fulvoviolaceus TaxID=285535 RepID=UPI0021C0A7EB|nr:tautomerase family protein [Streptomyces fulvoviolaceus]MCT9076612.1 tautomerase family protein [Streptomyces fulvoviolaceus]